MKSNIIIKHYHNSIKLYDNNILVTIADITEHTKSIFINEIITMPEHRNKNYFKTILNYIKQYSIISKKSYIELFAQPLDTNITRLQLINIYKKQGFKNTRYINMIFIVS